LDSLLKTTSHIKFFNVLDAGGKTVTTQRKTKVTERFKRPFKKRHASVLHQPSNRVNKYLAQAIEARSVDLEKTCHVHPVTLSFRDRHQERLFHSDSDRGFASALVLLLAVLVCLGAIQAIILPRTFILLLLFLTAFAWIAIVLMLLLATRLHLIIWDLARSPLLRIAISVFSIILVYAVGQVNVVSFNCTVFVLLWMSCNDSIL